MSGAKHLRAVEPASDKEALRIASAKAGKHIGDELRAEIAARNWAAVHIRGDRSRPIALPVGWRARR